MGTWVVGTFENDSAADFVWDVGDRPAIATIMAPIENLIDAVRSGDYLESGLCAESNAAAELLAALRYGDKSALSPSAVEVIAKLRDKPTDVQMDQARAIADRIARDSELSEAFAESDACENWQAAMAGLRERLG